MRIGFAITQARSIESTWTTVGLAISALRRGWEVRFIEPWDFEVDDRGQLIARAHAFSRLVGPQVLADALSSRAAPRRFVDLAGLDLLLLRAAPLDTAVLTFATLVQDTGVPVVNDPLGLLRVSHKAWLAGIEDAATPPTLVTRSRAAASLFHERQPDGVVMKPARGSGGRGVSFVREHEFSEFDEAFDAAKRVGDGYVVVQRYLPDAEAGEKRLMWLDGEVIGGYLRRRAPGEFRHNLKRGGLPHPTQITAADRAIVATVTPRLLQAGIRLAGLDVIGRHVIEVNALNPGGAFHTDRLNGTDLADTIMGRLAEPRVPHLQRAKWAHPAP